MKLCRVIGNVVSTEKNPSFTGHKLMIVQPIDEEGNDIADSFLSNMLVILSPKPLAAHPK